MARAVLVWALPAMVVFAAPARGVDLPACSSKSLDGKVQTLERQMAAGAIYKELCLRFGKPLTCTVDAQSGRTNLTVTFRRGAKLIALTDPEIELSEQRVERVQMNGPKAIALLKRAEAEAYRPAGCGISWTGGEEESKAGGTREVVYRGETCNCQGRLIYRGDWVVTLVLRSAC